MSTVSKSRLVGAGLVAGVIAAAGLGCGSSKDCSGPTVLGICTTGENDGSAGNADAATGTSDAQGAGPAALGFVPSNLGAIDTSGIAGDLLFTGNCTLSSKDDGKAACGGNELMGYRGLEVAQNDGSKIRVFLARNIRIPSSATVIGSGSEPIALVALDTVEVSGLLSVGANHGTATAGGGPGNDLLNNIQGKGAGGGKPGSSGGGGAFCGKGGTGAGMAGGAGGTPFGKADLIPLLGGSAGGGTLSGGGGGALAVIAGTRVSVSTTGTINAGGGGCGDGITYSSGAGSGGSVLIEAPAVLIAGKVAANAGSGAGANHNGLDATLDAAPTNSGAGGDVTGPGVGGGGDMPDGTAGAIGADGRVISSAGGGAGRIRINTTSGAATISGTVSPTAATPCTTQGTLAK